MPSANTANWVRAPPEKSRRNSRAPPWPALSFERLDGVETSMPGTGTCDPSRYSRIMNTVKRILFRRSGTLNMFFMLESTGVPLGVAQPSGRSAQRLVRWLPLAGGRPIAPRQRAGPRRYPPPP